ncbi:LuxR C-terminal-related transcriptional regulator [Paraburkholderia dilworthii]|uniref:LuxR C-terminal-related transcriptional regulator n=1 Tax=Paraburkholderia dilworthii TaxID=948106 RepID=A0ABW9D6B4_9BURK
MEAFSNRTGHEWRVSLIQTKMMPPCLPPGCVQRLALLNRLSERWERSVTVVTAPAGFGKTTLLAEWSAALSEQKYPVAWLSLDEEDDDPQQFGAYLVAAFSRASEDIGWQAQQLLNNDPLTPIRTVISVLLNGIAAFDRCVFLVLDDADRLTAKPVLAIALRLLRYAPENMHVLLGARGEPALMLGQLRTPEKLMRVNVDDLRFSIDEAQVFFDQTGTAPLDRTSVKLLNETTEGWVAGLQLASLALTQAGDAARVASNLAGSGSGIDRYLNDTVLKHLPSPMLRFLLYTSILERLTPGVCDAIMGGGAESGKKLDWLERHNVFIRPLDERQEWYRYHALLSDALRRRLLRQMPHEAPLLHRRACQWFASAHLWPEAVRHALAAGEVEQAANWAENCAIEMLERGEPYTLLGWIEKLPANVVHGRLRLRLTKAWAFALSLQLTRASTEINAVVDQFNQMYRHHGGVAEETALAEVNAIGALIAGASDDSERAFDLGRAAEASMASAAPWVKHYAHFGQILGLTYRGEFDQIVHIREVARVEAHYGQEPNRSDLLREAQYSQAALIYGELADARQVLEAAIRGAEKALGTSSSCTTVLAGLLSSVYYEYNELPEARKVIAGRMTIALQTAPQGGLARHLRCAVRLLWRDGEMGSALAVLEDGRQVAIARQWLRLKLACDAETVRLLLDDGHVTRARQIADELSTSVPMMCEGRVGSAAETWTSYCLVQARVLIAENLGDRAVIILVRLLDILAALGWRPSEALACLLLARAFEQSGASEKAITALGRALRIGGAIGMINSVVDEGPSVRELLRRFCQVSGKDSFAEIAYANRLLAVFDELDNSQSASGRSVQIVTSSPDILSARELEIVTCVARGLSNKEVGRALKLAPETVKWHMKNIFEKLNVSSRIEAVQSVLGFKVGEDRAAM